MRTTNARPPAAPHGFDESTIFVTGEAKSPTNNPITSRWGLFFVGLVVDTDEHIIVRADCTAVLPVTIDFVRSLLEGQSILDEDGLVGMITERYHGSSQRALAAAVRNAASKYREILSGPT